MDTCIAYVDLEHPRNILITITATISSVHGYYIIL